MDRIIVTGVHKHFVISGDVVGPDQFDHDWTDSVDKQVWQFLSNKRYEMMKEALLRGETVQFRGSGNSLFPFVRSGDVCFLEPIGAGLHAKILPGDIVFCAVQPKDLYYVHLVWRVDKWETSYGVSRDVFIIGNNKDGLERRRNGWCYREHLYGILVRTQRGVHEPVRQVKHDY